MNPTFRKYLPHAVAVVLFAILTLIYFRPLLSGKELRQDDISRHRAMSKEIADYREQHGKEPLWTNSMFGGMPAYQISTLYPGNWIAHLDQVFKLFLPLPAGYLFLYFLGFFILLMCLKMDPWLALAGALAYGLGSYFLIIIEAGHNSKANALGYLPALVGGVILLFNGRRWLGLACTTLFTAMELNANHVQISYYGYILIGFMIAGYAISAVKRREFSAFASALGLFLLATMLGLLPNAGNLLTTYEYGKYSTRGPSELTARSLSTTAVAAGATKEQIEKNQTSGLDADYATKWSYGIGETFTFLIPDFKGGGTNNIQSADPDALKKVRPEMREAVASSNAYFGDQPFTSGPVYMGAIVMFLAVLGMFIVKHAIKWPVLLATVLTVMLSWGNNFMPLTEFFLHYVPGYNKFRAVAMILVVAELTLPLIAAMAVGELLRLKWKDGVRLRLIGKTVALNRLVWISAAATGGFCLLAYLAPEVFNNFTATGEEQMMVAQYVQAGYPEDQVRNHLSQLMPQLEIARQEIFRSDALRSAIFIALALLAVYLFFTGRITRHLFLGALGVFITIDLWTVANRYLNERSFIPRAQNQMAIIQKTAADDEILRDTTLYYRVLNLEGSRWQDAMTSYYHKSVGGYHGAKLKKFQELIDFHLDREIGLFYRDAERALGSDSTRKALLSRLGVINMLNTRYLILPGGSPDEELPLLNPVANGNAWFVQRLKVVADADEEILALDDINTKAEAVVRKKYMEAGGYSETYPADGNIRLTAYAPNQLTYAYAAPQEVFAVFSEIYYPAGWNAYIDGQPATHVAVNYLLRGMELPAGSHVVEFRFEPRSYHTGNAVAMAGSVLVLLVAAGGVYLHRRNKVIVS